MSHSGDSGRRRTRQARWTGIATLLARGIAIGLSIATLPLASRYLGRERYGLWLTLVSFITWISILNFGLSNSLVNVLVREDDESQTSRQAVSSAFWLIILVASFFILAALAVTPLIDWAAILNVSSSQAREELRDSITLVVVCTAIRLPTSIVIAIYQAYQQGYLYQIWSGIGGVVSAFALVVAIQLGAGLPWLVAVSFGGFICADLIGLTHQLGWSRSWLRPSLSAFRWSGAIQLIKQGLQFWLAQLSVILTFQVGLLVTSRLFGAGQVAEYGTMLRLFTLVGAIQTAFVEPLWAAYSEAFARHDYRWVVETFRHSLRVSLLWTVTATFAVLALMPWLFRMLVKADITPAWSLALAMMALEIVSAAARCISTLLNGLGALRLQAICGPIAGLTNLLLSVVLGRLIGPAGVVWATVTCLLIFWIALMGRDAGRRVVRLQGFSESGK